MRKGLLLLALILCSITSVPAQVSVGIGLPNVSVALNIAAYPELGPVPGCQDRAPHAEAGRGEG